MAGIYPLLENNKTWLLAIDFDKSDWQDASLAYVTACKENQIDCLLERSRSGNGAHVWVFFDEAIDAKIARQLGFYLLDQAMKIHGTLSFDSYDRLFPNQDVLPAGGIGNLIALPLQKQARAIGNSTFVDEFFIPFQNQWAALATIKRLSFEKIERILKNQSEHKKGPIYTKLVKPWERFKTEKTPEIYAKEIDVVIANKLYFLIAQLPNFLMARFKKLALFSNPKFFKAQGLRLSINGISRFICLAEVDGEYLSLPRGCLDDIQAICSELGITLNLMLAGKVRHAIKANSNVRFTQSLYKRSLTFTAPEYLLGEGVKINITDVYRWLVSHTERNSLIIKDIKDEVLQGRVPIVLTERREHADIIANLLANEGITYQVLVGAMKKKQQAQVMAKINTTQVLIATSKFIGEGFDLPRLDTLILTLPISWKGSLTQYVGRIQRQFEGKIEIRVIDYVDENIPMLVKMFKRRQTGYAALGFSSVDKAQQRLI